MYFYIVDVLLGDKTGKSLYPTIFFILYTDSIAQSIKWRFEKKQIINFYLPYNFWKIEENIFF